MSGFLDWFKNRTKIKRWLSLILLGIVLLCYGVSEVIVLEELGVFEVAKIVISFVLGFVFVITGFIFSQKRILEIFIEASTNDNIKNMNAIDVQGLIFNRKVYDLGPKIVVIGGGSGMSSVLKGLKNYTSNITAIAPVTDDSELSEYYRKELDILPPVDIRNSLIALSKEDIVLDKLLNYRFSNGRLKDTNFGDVYIAAMKDIYGGLPEGLENSNKTLNIIGKVIPVTYDEVTICAELWNGMVAESELEIQNTLINNVTEVRRVFLKPSTCRVVPTAIKAIEEADIIVIGPGSLYTNIIPNLLMRDVSKAIKNSKAISIYVSNIMTEPGQTDSYSLYDYIQKLQDHAGTEIIDYCICDTGEIVPEFIKKYNQQGADVIEKDIEKLKAKRIQVIQEDLSTVQGEFIRHDADKLARSIIKIILEDLNFKNKHSGVQYLLLKHISKYQNKKKPKRLYRKAKQKKTINSYIPRKKGAKSKFSVKYDSRIQSIRDSDITRQKNVETSKKTEE